MIVQEPPSGFVLLLQVVLHYRQRVNAVGGCIDHCDFVGRDQPERKDKSVDGDYAATVGVERVAGASGLGLLHVGSVAVEEGVVLLEGIRADTVEGDNAAVRLGKCGDRFGFRDA